MDSLLVKMFATALALSQVTRSGAIKTEFDPVHDQPEVVQLLATAARTCARRSTSRTSISTT